MRASSRRFTFDQPLTRACVPVVVNTRSVPMFGTDRIRSRAQLAASGTTCSSLVLRPRAGMVQVAPSPLNSERRIPATSLSRQPVSSSSLSSGPTCCSADAACQNFMISASVRTRSRDCRALGPVDAGARVRLDAPVPVQPREHRRQSGEQVTRPRLGRAVLPCAPSGHAALAGLVVTAWMSWPSIVGDGLVGPAVGEAAPDHLAVGREAEQLERSPASCRVFGLA